MQKRQKCNKKGKNAKKKVEMQKKAENAFSISKFIQNPHFKPQNLSKKDKNANIITNKR